MLQSEFSQRHQICRSKEISKGAFCTIRGIDVPAPHARLERFRSQIDEHNLIYTLHDPVGNGFTHRHAGDLLNDWGQAFDVLHIHGRENVDPCLQDFEDVLVPFAVLASINVGVCEFVHERDLGFALDDGVDVHLLEQRAFVVQLAARHMIEAGGEFGDALASVGLDDSDDHVLSTATSADSLAEHVVRLSNTWGVAEKQLEDCLLLFGSRLLEPLLWGLSHDAYSLFRPANCRIVYNLAVKRLVQQIVRYVVVSALDIFITWFCFRIFHHNPTTVGFVFLLAILVVSASWGLRQAIFMSVLASLLYNFFFLPPFFTLVIYDPQNWIALTAFLATAVIGSQLSERARRRAAEANQRRREVERLYTLTQQVLVTENVFELLNKLPAYVTETFEASGAALFLENKGKVYYSDIGLQKEVPVEKLRAVSGRGEPVFDRDQHIRFMPMRMGVRSIGSFAVVGSEVSRETLEAVGSLIATAMERAATFEQLSKAEAARESDRLRALLLDSVTHEFRTPLTAIKASAQTLLEEVELDKPQLKELATVINEESDRLDRIVGEASEVAQLDARKVELQVEPHAIAEAIDKALQHLKNTLDKHTIEQSISPNLPAINMDLERIVEVLVQLLDNAAKYSPAESAIHITAEIKDRSVVTSIADHGAGIDDIEQSMIFEKFYRGRNQRVAVKGTGMGLAIARAIVELHGGTIGVTSQLGRGSVFYFSLPVS